MANLFPQQEEADLISVSTSPWQHKSEEEKYSLKEKINKLFQRKYDILQTLFS